MGRAPFPANSLQLTSTQIDSWLPHLPLHTVLTVIQQLQPELRSVISPPSTPAATTAASATPATPATAATTTAAAGATAATTARPSIAQDSLPLLERLRTFELRGIEPIPVKTHMFEWSPLALGWYESLLWGFIFVGERNVSKGAGTVGVWNGTAVRLFRVQETAPEGPSLLAPRGGVDAIGTNLMERLGNVTIGAARRDSTQDNRRGSRRGSTDSGNGAVRHAVV